MAAPDEQGQGAVADRIAQAQRGDASALEALVCANLGLVRHVAVRFLGRGLESDDLVQIGTMGLIRAIQRFDPERGNQLSTYAVPMIIGEIRRVLRDEGTMRQTRSLRELGARVLATEARLQQELLRSPTPAEIAEVLHTPLHRVVEALAAMRPLASLDDVVYSGERDEVHLEDAVVADLPDETAWADRADLERALRDLSALEREVIRLRFFEDLTQMEAARRLRTHQVRISRLERRALMHLYQRLRGEPVQGGAGDGG